MSKARQFCVSFRLRVYHHFWKAGNALQLFAKDGTLYFYVGVFSQLALFSLTLVENLFDDLNCVLNVVH